MIILCISNYAGPPVNVTAFSPNSRSLIVAWDSPADPEGIYGVILTYSVTCGANFSIIISDIDVEVTDALFDGLLPYTSYNCCVSMVTTKASSSAACQEGTTLEEGTNCSLGLTDFDIVLLASPSQQPSSLMKGLAGLQINFYHRSI